MIMVLCTQCGGGILRPRVSPDFPSLQTRLRSELGPAPAQPEEVASILKNIELDLQDYEAEIDQLEARALFLTTLKERLSEYGHRARTLLSPIRKLPDELLCEIFDLCCGMNCFSITELPVSSVFSFRSAPAMSLSSVCSRWRKNALAMPSIWSRISLKWSTEVDDGSPWGDEGCLPLYLFMTRSVSRPLSVTLDFETYPGLNDGQAHPIIAKLTHQIHRWQRLSFSSHRCLLDSLFGIDLPHFPLLEDVELDNVPVDCPDPDLDFLRGKAPNLKRLMLISESGLHVNPSRRPLTQITHIDFNPNLFHLEVFLEDNPNLASLALNEDADGDPEYTASPRTCAQMQALTVRHEANVRNSVFSAMRCPSLKSLHFEPFTLPLQSWGGYSSFMAFVQRSSFPLTTLSIKSLPLSDYNLVYLLHHLPTLVNLSIDDSMLPPGGRITEEFINSLHAYRMSSLRSNASPIIPRLWSLILSCGASKFNDALVVDMVKSRWFSGAQSGSSGGTKASSAFQVDCLREFTLKFRKREQVHHSVYATLERLEKNGMRAMVLWGLHNS
ncbi:hypothetical protein D9757_010205 [Collybiopsis confluens]|uniref:F-box domain-containing protein n=1 Tax=Collybiopsis confluens TaxID=2823264 RepID=A0A8H5LSS1_9AGAR|nr:hypothetical protein D9757_010205 [Collybiopsis confluens]